MAGDFKFLSRDELDLTPYAQEIVDAFETIAARHLPGETVNYAKCSGCDHLHVYAARNKKANGRMIRFDIPPTMYRILTKQ